MLQKPLSPSLCPSQANCFTIKEETETGSQSVVLTLWRRRDVVTPPQLALVASETVFSAVPVTATNVIRGTAVQ